jgi:hypothetical protein
MISPKTLAGFNAKGRRVAPVARSIVEARAQLIARIDEFWRYYCDPANYSYMQRQFDVKSGRDVDVYCAAQWRDQDYIVQSRDGAIVVSLFWEGRYLPLTKRGDQEIIIPVATRHDIEQILAEIKHSIKTGAMDSYLVNTPSLPSA